MNMSKLDFSKRIPSLINHKVWGEGELEIIADYDHYKCACYKHKGNFETCKTMADNWEELYEALSLYLKREGYIN